MKTRRPWTLREDALLRSMYPECFTRDVAAWLARTPSSTNNRALLLGLHKSPAYMASLRILQGQHARTHPAILARRFRPGREPWNKGMHYMAGGRSVETRFQPGQKPVTTMPLGTYRVMTSHSGPQLQVKTGTQPGPSHLRWTPVSRLVWEAANGPVPPGHLVVFRKPALRTTVLEEITLDRLECISRAEHARRNGPYARSPELGRLAQLKGAINRQVNRITREAQEARTA